MVQHLAGSLCYSRFTMCQLRLLFSRYLSEGKREFSSHRGQGDHRNTKPFVSKRVQLFGVKFTCPERFRDGVNIVTCKINMTAIKEADCSSLQPFVTFDRTVNSSTVTKCHTPSFNSSTCSHIQEADANSCWCNMSDREIFYYMFAYKANHTQDVGTHLECKVCASPNNHLVEEISDHCKHLKFNNPSTCLVENCDNTDNKENSSILLIILPVILIIGVIIGVAVYCFKHKGYPKSSWWRCRSTTAETTHFEDVSKRRTAEEKSKDQCSTDANKEVLLNGGTLNDDICSV